MVTVDLRHIQRSDLRSLNLMLQEEGYNTQSILRAINNRDTVDQAVSNIARYSLYYQDSLSQVPSSSSILGQLFLFCSDVSRRAAATLLPQLFLLLMDVGLVVSVPGEPDQLRASVAITELRGNFFMSDRLFSNKPSGFTVEEGNDLCMPPHASSIELLNALTKPPRAVSFLDVGCGSGCQSQIVRPNYERVVGFDLNNRAVDYARVNAELNDLSVEYRSEKWETFADETAFDHIAFNAPDSRTAIEFLNTGMPGLLSSDGSAQVWFPYEVEDVSATVEQLLRREILSWDSFSVSVQVKADSPFTLSSRAIDVGRLPAGTLLVKHPSEATNLFRDLKKRRIREIVSVVVTLTRRPR